MKMQKSAVDDNVFWLCEYKVYLKINQKKIDKCRLYVKLPQLYTFIRNNHGGHALCSAELTNILWKSTKCNISLMLCSSHIPYFGLITRCKPLMLFYINSELLYRASQLCQCRHISFHHSSTNYRQFFVLLLYYISLLLLEFCGNNLFYYYLQILVCFTMFFLYRFRIQSIRNVRILLEIFDVYFRLK